MPPAFTGSGWGHGANSQFSPVLPTVCPPGHTLTSLLQADKGPALLSMFITPLSFTVIVNVRSSEPALLDARMVMVYCLSAATCGANPITIPCEIESHAVSDV